MISFRFDKHLFLGTFILPKIFYYLSTDLISYLFIRVVDNLANFLKIGGPYFQIFGYHTLPQRLNQLRFYIIGVFLTFEEANFVILNDSRESNRGKNPLEDFDIFSENDDIIGFIGLDGGLNHLRNIQLI